jgi:hypothetical protein
VTAWIEGKRGFYLGAQAYVLDDSKEVAWAEKHIVHNPAHKWIIGKFVEAEKANNNRQYFSLDGLRMAQPTIAHAPMNMNHSGRRIVGAYVATDFVYPTGSEEEAAAFNPFIEALAVFWAAHFPEDWNEVEKAHAEGHLYYSMECVPSHLKCAGENGCNQEFEYAGRTSPSYCQHLNQGASEKFLVNPHFTAGACIVPPVRPGWNNADVHSLVANHADAADRVYAEVAQDMDHLGPREWELMMVELLAMADKTSVKKKKSKSKITTY